MLSSHEGTGRFVTIDLRAVEQLAADQSSLKAAAGLTRPAKWSGIGISADATLIWGECAGSGANPYRVMADLRDLGNKCTCPSRKFPCKHVLALLWIRAEAILPFPAADTPEWVSDWLGRRRTGGAARPAAAPGAPRDLSVARTAEPEAAASQAPKAAARREAASAKRAQDTERAALEAMDALEQWIGDQLRMGLASFIDEATTRCRRIAARLVDGKAAALAGRVDELPARLLALPAGDRARGAVVELGKLVTLARAFRAAPRDPAILRAVTTAESRETLLAAPDPLIVSGSWEVLAEHVRTRRDGLVSQTCWLLDLNRESASPRFAMLQDFFPASAGRRASAFTPGERFLADLLFYPSSAPLRALLIQRRAGETGSTWPQAEAEPITALATALHHEPWALDVPMLLPPGRLALDASGAGWWQSADAAVTLPLAEEPTRLALGTDLLGAAALWSGNRLRLLAAQTAWGRIDGHA